MESLTRTWVRDNVPIEIDPLKDKGREQRFGPWGNADYQRHTTNELLRQLIRTTLVAGGGKPKGQWKPNPAPKPKVVHTDETWRQQLEQERARQEERRKAAGLPSVAEMGRANDGG